MTKIYKLSLVQKSGLLSELHSDTIWGHFCWRLLELYGKETLEKFLSEFNKAPVFTVSDGMSEINGEVFFPKPLLHSPYTFERSDKKGRVKKFSHYKNIRKNNKVSAAQLNLFLKGEIREYEETFSIPRKNVFTKYDLRVGVEIDRQTLKSKEGQLFTYHPKYLIPPDEENSSKPGYCILVRVLDEEKFRGYKCDEILNAVFSLGFGKKKSTGFGEFEITGYEEYKKLQEPETGNGFVVLGNYLPADSDGIQPEFSYYDFNVKYGRLGESLSLSPNPFKRPIIFFTTGSCFRTNVKKEFYGRVTGRGEISPSFPEAVQFGVPFTLKFNYRN